MIVPFVVGLADVDAGNGRNQERRHRDDRVSLAKPFHATSFIYAG